jgi:hypothetical protein
MHERLRRLWRTWSSLSRRQRIIAGVIAALLISVVATMAVRRSSACYTRQDAEARLAGVTSQLQQLASTKGLSVQAFAGALKDLNDAAHLLDAENDPKAYCERLSSIANDHAAE